MSADLSRRQPYDLTPTLARRTARQLDAITARSLTKQAQIEVAADETAAVVQARNAVAAVAAQADAMLSGMLAALPITDATDADFRAQLKQVTRANVAADLYRFQP
jgi:hypothetical protein